MTHFSVNGIIGKIFGTVSVMVLSSYGIDIHAKEFSIRGGVGSIFVSNDEYKSADAYDLSASYVKKKWRFNIGAITLNHLRPNGASEDTHLDIDAWSFSVNYTLTLGDFWIAPGGGILRSSARPTLIGNELPEVEENNRFFHIIFAKQVSPALSIFLDAKHLSKFYGDSANLSVIGIEYTF